MTQSTKLTQLEALKIVAALAKDAADLYVLSDLLDKHGKDQALCEAIQKQAVEMVEGLIGETEEAEDNPIGHGLDYLKTLNVLAIAIPASQVRLKLIESVELSESEIDDVTDEEIFEKLSFAEGFMGSEISTICKLMIKQAADDIIEKYSHPVSDEADA